MHFLVKEFILLVGFLSCLSTFALVSAVPYGDTNNDIYSNDDYEDDSAMSKEENQIYAVPKFESTSINELVNEGGTIRLPCIVDRLEGFVLLWKKGDSILAVGKQMVEKDNRYQLESEENGNTLVISLADQSDAGNYTCQISTFQPSEIHHTIKIRVRPEVVSIPESGLIVAQTGESVTLACQVTKGNPQPEVKWHRRERKMPSGEEFIRGLSFTYTSVSRHHSGNYICSADNGFGEPSETTLKLDVQHAPEIDQDETFIHTGEGYETEIVCVIHSSPRAEVSWLKDGFPIDSSATNEITHRGNRHTLLLRDVKEESFGDYTCQAKNLHGEAEKTTRVSGKANDVNFKSDPKGPNYDQYALEWTAQSSTPITHFKVQYKAETDVQWTEAEIEAVNVDREFYAGGYTLPQLRPATVYMTRVASQNSYGYNDYGEIFKFATKDPVQKPMTAGALSLVDRQPFRVVLITLVSVIFAHLSSR
ncbi:lachesin-like isoform X2 [Tigriopus californicus]|uniref:lachesin-like isoform X2 n=1 Tax=Tigriopus californicus TaxID=6832 RepID=UPI0027DA74D7|nr:lachesin-like isoform X2 [Tigriopus californicus]